MRISSMNQRNSSEASKQASKQANKQHGESLRLKALRLCPSAGEILRKIIKNKLKMEPLVTILSISRQCFQSGFHDMDLS